MADHSMTLLLALDVLVTIDRVRWEIGPDAATTRVHRDSDGVWRPVPQEDAAV